MGLYRRIYYQVKPLLHWRLRLSVRRWAARRRLRLCGDVWPIKADAGKVPPKWPGWPEGKRFAFILTHDVERPVGVQRCRQLMELEARLGFRSSFNFIPEGPYSVPRELRQHLTDNGFEVGVHDLKHDGKLYHSRARFEVNARRINHYLQEWNAVGFRSAFMHHNLVWLQRLNIQYDASTFDTDPFEPQPDGVDTIFPFWVTGPNGTGYVELPYTLSQDSTLFLLLGENSIEKWTRKLDWVVERGGMVLVDTHPDYMSFSGAQRNAREFPLPYYEQFLNHVRSRYGTDFWHALPKDVANYSRTFLNGGKPTPPASATAHVLRSSPKMKIWIDLDNTPHVPFFEPIIEELSARGHEVLLTARDAFQVCELADEKGMRYIKVGRHHGKNRILKLTGLFYRALQLAPTVLQEKPDLGLSHGSRSQVILSNLLGIPTVLLADYEFARGIPLLRPTWEIVPEAIPDSNLQCEKDRIRKYPGLKEDVYAPRLRPDPTLLRKLGVDQSSLIVTVRPPATEAHYHNPESEVLFTHFMERACRTPEARVVLLPRNARQTDSIRSQWPHWFVNQKTVIPQTAVDGLNLLWHSDLVVSGGGTMNREAAALGVPVYSIFRGKTGAVDQCLDKEGRLVMIHNVEEVDRRIILVRRDKKTAAHSQSREALPTIIRHLEEIISVQYPAQA